MKKPITIRFSTSSPQAYLIRFTPGSKGLWGDFRFIVDEPVRTADWWVVLDNVVEKQTTQCPPENTLLVTHETENIKRYDQKFIDQFNWVITCQRDMKHPRKIYTQQAHLWHVGWLGSGSGVDPKERKNLLVTYDKLSAITQIEKTGLLANVTSYKSRTSGQAMRREFLGKVKEHFGNRFHMFGAGIEHIRDKWDGIAPYRYYLAIDNSYIEDYWTSNLADAYLGGAYPIYYGHPSVFNYFSKDALTLIDIHDVEESIKTIEKVVQENYYEKHLKDIWEARRLVLDKYNIFALIADTIASLPQGNTPRQITLNPEYKPVFKKRLIEIIHKVPLLNVVAKKIHHAYRGKLVGAAAEEEKKQEQWLHYLKKVEEDKKNKFASHEL